MLPIILLGSSNLKKITMIGKWILIIGGILVAVGAVLWLLESVGVPLGRFPGDIRMKGEGWSFRFPLVTCLILSIALTVLLNVVVWMFRR